MRYPDMELEMGVQGKVLLQFVVRRDGRLTDVRVLRGVPEGPNLNQEAMRVVKGMPRWIPGEMNGEKVNAQVHLPVLFKLKDQPSEKH